VCGAAPSNADLGLQNHWYADGGAQLIPGIESMFVAAHVLGHRWWHSCNPGIMCDLHVQNAGRMTCLLKIVTACFACIACTSLADLCLPFMAAAILCLSAG
jgi:hypothetical protein